jgi:hypothetical protein
MTCRTKRYFHVPECTLCPARLATSFLNDGVVCMWACFPPDDVMCLHDKTMTIASRIESLCFACSIKSLSGHILVVKREERRNLMDPSPAQAHRPAPRQTLRRQIVQYIVLPYSDTYVLLPDKSKCSWPLISSHSLSSDNFN